MPRRTISTILVAAALLAGACSGADYGRDDIEYQLATIQLGHQPDMDDDGPLLDRLAADLDAAEPLCTQDRDMLGDMAASAWQTLQDEGRSESMVNLVGVYSDNVPAEAAPVNCAEIMAVRLSG